MKNIGSKVRALRIEKEITLPELAKRAQLSKGIISKIENSKETNPSLDTLFQIAEALEVSLSTFLETEKAQLVRILPNDPPAWQKELVESLQADGKMPDPNILNAMCVLRNRKGAKKADLAAWKLLYLNIENSFKP
jgi:transcriptional regulator with XRE-family HTH domain